MEWQDELAELILDPTLLLPLLNYGQWEQASG
jgi:hypothetical protein